MADGSLIIALDDETAAKLADAAQQAGEDDAVFAARLLARALEDDRWAIAEARIEEYERTGVAEDAAPFLDRLRKGVVSEP